MGPKYREEGRSAVGEGTQRQSTLKEWEEVVQELELCGGKRRGDVLYLCRTWVEGRQCQFQLITINNLTNYKAEKPL